MLIELHTQSLGRWYWVTFQTANQQIGLRLVVTRMDPRNIAVTTVACTVYGICDQVQDRHYVLSTGEQITEDRWVSRKIGFGREHSGFAYNVSLDDAKAWLLATVASRLRQQQLPRPKYSSPYSRQYTYEPIL